MNLKILISCIYRYHSYYSYIYGFGNNNNILYIINGINYGY